MENKSYNQWLVAFLKVANIYGLDVSEENAKTFVSWDQSPNKEQLLTQLAKQLGLSIRFQSVSKSIFDPWRLPVVIEFDENQIGVIIKSDNKEKATLMMSNDDGLSIDLSFDEIYSQAKKIIILRPESSIPDARVDDYIQRPKKNWFWQVVLKDWKSYSHIIMASLFVNLLALASVIFSMQVYDRVIPAQSQSTLWVLFLGVVIAICFEFLLRFSRTHISDAIGKKIDLKISDKVFGRALRLRNDVRSKSTGSFVSQLRELDQLREVVASTTINALADVPFVIVFMSILFLIGGPLTIVALIMIPLLVIPSIMAQKPLARLAKEGMRESAIRNALLIESVEAIEDIKLLRAEYRYQNQWNHVNTVSASVSLKQRRIVSFLVSWSQELQSFTYVAVLLIGAYMVIDGNITTGTLVGSSILSSRLIAPLAQWTGVLSRLQSAKVAYRSVNELMSKAVDYAEHDKMLHKPHIKGDYELSSVELTYDPKDKSPALSIESLKIKAGERVAILGRMGAGKSTLLNLLCGMSLATKGAVQVDHCDIRSIDPLDVRRDIAFLSQNSRLLFGSIRDNLLMGNPQATDQDLVQAIQITGAFPIIQKQGIDYVIKEGGKGLSEGQKQSLILARTLLKNPNVLLLDEPTASIDEMTEKHIINHLEQWLVNRTLILSTHKPALLKLVNRIIVIDQGKIVIDGSKEDVLALLSKEGQKTAVDAVKGNNT